MDDLWMRLAVETTGEYGSEVTPSLLAMNALKRWPR